MKWTAPIVLVLVGLLNIIPAIGVLGPEKLQILYGPSFTEANLQLLMRHRAVLFGLLGIYMIACAFIVEWRTFGLLAGFVSVASFLLLALLIEGPFNPEVAKVVRIDYVALAMLLLALLVQVLNQFRNKA